MARPPHPRPAAAAAAVLALAMGGRAVEPGEALAGPPACAAYGEFHPRVWGDFQPLASLGGPITAANVSDLVGLVHAHPGWEYYFVEVAVVEGRVLHRGGKGRLGPWQEATLKLLATTVRQHKDWVPEVHFVLSVLDEPFLERERQRPLPLLSFVTTRGHWDIGVPSHAFFESAGGISSGRVRQDFAAWEGEEWQRSLAKRYPWESRSERAFFRGHDWDSSNSLIEWLPSRGPDACVGRHDVTQSFGYRRWYAELSAAGGALADVLDVGLTGAPSFVEEKYPGRAYAAPVGLPEHARHKYLLHLDGTTASNRLIKLLMLGSVVLKQDSIYDEYFYRHLQPWVHFVPIERDRCSTRNLTDTLAWLRAHDAEARRIAEAGQRLARRLLSRGAAGCYWQRVLAVYGALQAFDPRLAIRASDFVEFHPPP